ncbi:MAG: FAD-dependent oxidoreductase [Solobacterium sp.]|jgi:phytoene dehydrogenase-like protein|nr:FAD-dependent oxidoreductase [Solobacterium sp.]MCI6744949.1 FAD-dependent oxidoreductase [Anaerolactibacter massiliensis]
MAYNPGQRICILGGGPSGLSMAMYLEQAGYEHVTILEKSDRIGGKCCSPLQLGKHYEMGAIMGVPSYHAVKECMAFAGIAADGPKMERDFRRIDGTVYEPFHPEDESELKDLQRQLRKLGLLLMRTYQGYNTCNHRGILNGSYEGFLPQKPDQWVSGTNEALSDLSLSFSDWCAKHEVPLIEKVWAEPFTGFGYGYFDEIPAAYVLKYLDFDTMMSFMRNDLLTWKDGTESIWQSVNRKLKHPAVCNALVSEIIRKDGQVQVAWNGNTESFDTLIVTSPLDQFCKYADVSDKERELFAKIRTEAYDTMAVLTDPSAPRSSCFFDNLLPKRLGHLMVAYSRWSKEPEQPIVTYALRCHTGEKEMTYEDSKALVLEDLEHCGVKVRQILNEASWYYFPHLSPKDYAEGWYDQVEAMQGENNTYYAGEVMCFGNMEETAEYAKELTARFFARKPL